MKKEGSAISGTSSPGSRNGGTDGAGRGSAATAPDEYVAAERLFYHKAALDAAWTGSRLLIGALGFLFGAFIFAYFYLRSLNSHGMWRPAGFTGPHLWAGTLITGLVAVSAIVQAGALMLAKRGAKGPWRLGAIAVLVMGLAAVGLQIWELLSVSFYPASSGFASVFTGFYPVYALIAFAAMIWLETLIMRAVKIPAGWFAEAPAAPSDVIVLQRFQASLSAFTAVWCFLTAIAVLAWMLFYLI